MSESSLLPVQQLIFESESFCLVSLAMLYEIWTAARSLEARAGCIAQQYSTLLVPVQHPLSSCSSPPTRIQQSPELASRWVCGCKRDTHSRLQDRHISWSVLPPGARA